MRIKIKSKSLTVTQQKPCEINSLNCASIRLLSQSYVRIKSNQCKSNAEFNFNVRPKLTWSQFSLYRIPHNILVIEQTSELEA